MSKSKRLIFLESFLKFYSVEEIELIEENGSSISGIAIYDGNIPEERNEFIWHKSEIEVPPIELNILIEKIISEKWHDGDRITVPIDEIEYSEFDNKTRDELIKELFEIEVGIINDDGGENDFYFVHW
jgi:hypothetical protein